MPSFHKNPKMTANKETGWSRIVKDIVRPPRSLYFDEDLGKDGDIQDQRLLF